MWGKHGTIVRFKDIRAVRSFVPCLLRQMTQTFISRLPNNGPYGRLPRSCPRRWRNYKDITWFLEQTWMYYTHLCSPVLAPQLFNKGAIHHYSTSYRTAQNGTSGGFGHDRHVPRPCCRLCRHQCLMSVIFTGVSNTGNIGTSQSYNPYCNVIWSLTTNLSVLAPVHLKGHPSSAELTSFLVCNTNSSEVRFMQRDNSAPRHLMEDSRSKYRGRRSPIWRITHL